MTTYFKEALLCSAMVILSVVASGQRAPLKALKIGDTVPDMTLKMIKGDSIHFVQLADFSGELLLLDYWTTWCSVCLKEFPKMETLQKRFGHQITILPVGFDYSAKGSIENYLTKVRGTGKELKLPTILQHPEDTVLSTLFPNQGFPHEVWIDRNRVVRAITDHLAVTEKNITSFLHGQQLKANNFFVREIIRSQSPYFMDLKRPNVEGSAFSGYNDSVISYAAFGRQLDSQYFRLLAINSPVLHLYKEAYRNPDFFDPWNKRIKYDHKLEILKDYSNTKTFDSFQMDSFNKHNLFCYEVVIPKKNNTLNDVYKKMIFDLDQKFGFKSRIGRFRRECYYLGQTNRFKETALKAVAPATISDSGLLISVGDLVKLMNNTFEGIYVVSNQVKDTKVRVDMEAFTLSTIAEILHDQGISIKKQRRTVDMLLLKRTSTF